MIPRPLSLWEADSQIQGHLGADGRHKVQPLPSRALLAPGLQLPGSLPARHGVVSLSEAPLPLPSVGTCARISIFSAEPQQLVSILLSRPSALCLRAVFPRPVFPACPLSSCLHVGLDIGCLLHIPSQRAHADQNLPWRAASLLSRTSEEWRLSVSVTLPPAPNTSAAQTVTRPSANKQEVHSTSKPKPKRVCQRALIILPCAQVGGSVLRTTDKDAVSLSILICESETNLSTSQGLGDQEITRQVSSPEERFPKCLFLPLPSPPLLPSSPLPCM